MNTRYASLFTIVGENEDGGVITSDGSSFDTTAYSRFKYGDMAAAAMYGQQLAQAILACVASQSGSCDLSNVVITASAYKSLPTAAQAVADAAIATLRANGYPVRTGRIHRNILTEGDYGTMTTDERAYWMSCNGLWVEAVEFKGLNVVVVDDISISGAHGRSIVQMFETIDIASLTLVHVLKLDPELAARDPKIEDRMNHSVIKTLQDLRQLIASTPDYAPNARTVKFVLSQPIQELQRFLDSLPDPLVRLLDESVQADEYDRMRSYVTAAKLIAIAAQERAHLVPA